MGRPAKPARLVIGAVIIKHKLCLSDQEAVDQIRENPYLQYFVDFNSFQTEAPPSEPASRNVSELDSASLHIWRVASLPDQGEARCQW